jgi:hypothetical protein
MEEQDDDQGAVVGSCGIGENCWGLGFEGNI